MSARSTRPDGSPRLISIGLRAKACAYLGLRWAATPGSMPDRTTNNENAPVEWIDSGGRIADGPVPGSADERGLPPQQALLETYRNAGRSR